MNSREMAPTVCALIVAAGIVSAQDLTVIGSKENVKQVPGSAAYVSGDEIRDRNQGDVHRILQGVPGVYTREEEGSGLFPNISIRGTSIGRSEKVTIMEDSIPAAPAPYSAPSAYYAPTAGRMRGLEILKGSSQIKYGPHTTGGVINYLSTSVPESQESYMKLLWGTDNGYQGHIWSGTTSKAGEGLFGIVLEGFAQGSDGFKTIDGTASTPSSDETGFEKWEGMIKLFWEPVEGGAHRFEFKYGLTDVEADETYYGLTDADLGTDPYRRYAATRFDNFEGEQDRVYLRHMYKASDAAKITTTAYYQDFHRNWYKLNDFMDDSGTTFKAGNALAPAGSAGLAVLQGSAAGSLNIKANNRDYETMGVETAARISFESGEMEHELDLGIRIHADEMYKFQHVDSYQMNADGSVASISQGTPGSSDDKIESAEAVALYAQDRIRVGRATFTPGIRVELVDYEVEDFKTASRKTGDLEAVAPGIGFTFDQNETLTFFGGVFAGISVPGAGGATRDDDPLEEEQSTSFELGLRFEQDDVLTELALYHTSFSDLIVPDNIGGGGAGDDENAGDIIAYGLEWKGQVDVGQRYGWAVSNPWFAGVTLTSAELDGDAASKSDGSIFFGGKDGNDVPYIPETQFQVGSAILTDRAMVEVTGHYMDSTWSTASNETDPNNAKVGRIDSRFILDVSASYDLEDYGRVVASIHNLADEEYIVSRHPEGPRPGRPLTAMIGWEQRF